jgi:hypothetical protein
MSPEFSRKFMTWRQDSHRHTTCQILERLQQYVKFEISRDLFYNTPDFSVITVKMVSTRDNIATMHTCMVQQCLLRKIG